MGERDWAIEARGLGKRFGEVTALDGFDLAVPSGTVHGLLGPNGAGKTTAVRVLATLLDSDEGSALVGGVDVARDPQEVRRRIGLTGQYAAVDEILTGRQNLELFGKLFHLGGRRAKARASELLERFDLADAGDKGVKAYSGGMRRRLDLAASMILAPQVLFLDEPTTGLDPRGRGEVWTAIRDLVAGGTTVLLTTQYLEEADQLADEVTVIDRGRNVATGTPSELKNRVGGDQIEVVAAEGADLAAVAAAFDGVSTGEPTVSTEHRTVSAPVADRVAALSTVASRLQASGASIEDITLRRPTLDDVFLRLTGHRAEEEASSPEAGSDGPLAQPATYETGADARTGADGIPDERESTEAEGALR
ncbi:ATP-binding cassette domain-containing protein [Knoellia subterranea]|uniref:IclR family transcriptional regulator n=1 Tax=Knoellia subterranea KCTC 19937 TaxID=1385521 RepID=A0A0A0JJI3_9MICO|nr:ATP-binding cassette domain-containing protein [Knoellia subterranea]KGN37540.1 IclR family transcriptional regulator [Knoellia subterranea KCTC 19937]